MSARRIDVVNKTSWRTDDLRRLVRGALIHEVGDWFYYEVVFVYTRGGGGGYGMYNHPWIKLCLPNKRQEWVVDDPNDRLVYEDVTAEQLTRREVLFCAEVAVHEIGHNKGLRHREMDVAAESDDLGWCERMIESGFRIRRRKAKAKAKAKPKRDVILERAARAAKLLATHEVKLRREERLVKKYRVIVRYFERALERREETRRLRTAARPAEGKAT